MFILKKIRLSILTLIMVCGLTFALINTEANAETVSLQHLMDIIQKLQEKLHELQNSTTTPPLVVGDEDTSNSSIQSTLKTVSSLVKKFYINNNYSFDKFCQTSSFIEATSDLRVICNSSNSKYITYVPSGNEYYCVDSTGVIKQTVKKPIGLECKTSNSSYTKKEINYLYRPNKTIDYEFTKTLRLGSRGLEVRKLQEALNIKITGYFGYNTARAVKEFQRSLGYRYPVPVFGPWTRGKINQKSKNYTTITTTTNNTTTNNNIEITSASDPSMTQGGSYKITWKAKNENHKWVYINLLDAHNNSLAAILAEGVDASKREATFKIPDSAAGIYNIEVGIREKGILSGKPEAVQSIGVLVTKKSKKIQSRLFRGADASLVSVNHVKMTKNELYKQQLLAFKVKADGVNINMDEITSSIEGDSIQVRNGRLDIFSDLYLTKKIGSQDISFVPNDDKKNILLGTGDTISSGETHYYVLRADLRNIKTNESVTKVGLKGIGYAEIVGSGSISTKEQMKAQIKSLERQAIPLREKCENKSYHKVDLTGLNSKTINELMQIIDQLHWQIEYMRKKSNCVKSDPSKVMSDMMRMLEVMGIKTNTIYKDLGYGFVFKKKGIYYNNDRLNIGSIAAKTFTVLNEFYQKDKNHIYYKGKPIHIADLKTFTVTNKPNMAKDKNYEYLNGRIVGSKNSIKFDMDLGGASNLIIRHGGTYMASWKAKNTNNKWIHLSLVNKNNTNHLIASLTGGVDASKGRVSFRIPDYVPAGKYKIKIRIDEEGFLSGGAEAVDFIDLDLRGARKRIIAPIIIDKITQVDDNDFKVEWSVPKKSAALSVNFAVMGRNGRISEELTPSAYAVFKKRNMFLTKKMINNLTPPYRLVAYHHPSWCLPKFAGVDEHKMCDPSMVKKSIGQPVFGQNINQ